MRRPDGSRRIAAIDVGSNSVKILVADVHEAPGAGIELSEIERWGRVTRIARGLSAGREINQEALAATRDALAGCTTRAAELGADRVIAAATGGLRLAADSARVAGRIGAGIVELPVLTAEIEARLSLLGIRAGAGWPRDLVAIDLGGASTEVNWLYEGRLTTASLDIGAVTLTERFLLSDPPAADELEELDRHVSGILSGMPVPPGDPAIDDEVVHGVGGTLTALAFLLLGHTPAHGSAVHGTCLDRDRIADVTDMLASISSAERQSSLGIGAGRADILVAGARVLLRTLDSMGRRRLQVSGWGLRHGLAIGAGQAGDPRLDAQLALRLATDEPPTTA